WPHAHDHVQVARGAAAPSRFALRLESPRRAILGSWWDRDRELALLLDRTRPAAAFTRIRHHRSRARASGAAFRQREEPLLHLDFATSRACAAGRKAGRSTSPSRATTRTAFTARRKSNGLAAAERSLFERELQRVTKVAARNLRFPLTEEISKEPF